MQEKKRIWIFVALAFGLVWVSGLILTLAGGRYGEGLSRVWLMGSMLMPALASILTRVFTKEGFRNMGWAPGFKNGGWKWYVAACCAPFVCMLLGAAAYFLLFPDRFDPSGAALNRAFAASSGYGIPPEYIPLLIGLLIIAGLLMAPIVNVPFTLGEELGWQAYLLPKLRGLYGPRRAVLLTGVIWGLWHAPMIAMGHNYGTGYWGWPVLGILAMVVFCLAMGSFEALLTFRTGSVWPAAMAHSSLNAIAGVPLFFALGTNSPFIGPMMTGILGGWALLVLGVLCFLRCGKEVEHVHQGDV